MGLKHKRGTSTEIAAMTEDVEPFEIIGNETTGNIKINRSGSNVAYSTLPFELKPINQSTTAIQKGSGAGQLADASAGTDYLAPSGSGSGLSGVYKPGRTDVAITDGGTGASTLPTGILVGAGTGAITAATAGTDYALPLYKAILASTASVNGGGGTGDQTLWTTANLASGNLVAGQTMLRMRVGGSFDNINSSGAFTGKVKINTVTVATIAIAVSQTTLASATAYYFDLDIIVDTTGASGAVTVYGNTYVITAAGGAKNFQVVLTTTGSVNLSGGLQVVYTGTLGTANAGNIIRATRGIVSQIA